MASKKGKYLSRIDEKFLMITGNLLKYGSLVTGFYHIFYEDPKPAKLVMALACGVGYLIGDFIREEGIDLRNKRMFKNLENAVLEKDE